MRLPETVYNEVLRGLGLQDHGISTCLHEQTEAAAADAANPTAVAVHPDDCKRRSRRRRLNAPVQFLRHGTMNARPQVCTLLDASRDGVCVMMDSVVAPGDRFVLYLPRTSEAGARLEPLALLCTARSSRLKQGGKFRTGAEFTDANEDSEVGAKAVSAERLAQTAAVNHVFVRTAGRLDTEPDANARRTDRTESFGRATMYLFGDDGSRGPLEHVETRDYSDTGVGILRVEPLAVGDQFVIQVPRADDRPITRLCKVVNVALAAGRYRIGAQFIPFPGPRGRTFLSKVASWIG
jgi:hypothetical protein